MLNNRKALPRIIQGGMGAGVSTWQLAKAVSQCGHLGVVSGTALDVILARRLQLGDLDGDLRRALKAFPCQDMANRILDRYYIEGGKAPDKPFKSKPMIGHKFNRLAFELMVVSNFVEVFLAKEDHDGLVGINYLEKIQAPNLPSIYGAILADVDVVLMGAGIPKSIPEILDRLSKNEPVELKLNVVGASPDSRHVNTFDPAQIMPNLRDDLKRPDFYAIVASVTLANMMVKKASSKVNGLIIEGPTAGGHNAPPRGKTELTVKGEPKYGEKDEVNLDAIGKLGVPFWLAGSYGSPDQLQVALESGATGIQVGTLFAYSNESGMTPEIKSEVITQSLEGRAKIFTDPVASPTGFPFKVVQLDETNSNSTVYQQRNRICDLGYLREAYEKEDGSLNWRCPSEPVNDFLKKGGQFDQTEGRKCLCNGLMANIGMEQVRKDNVHELPLVTSGDEVTRALVHVVQPGQNSYTAKEVIDYLMSGIQSKAPDLASQPN